MTRLTFSLFPFSPWYCYLVTRSRKPQKCNPVKKLKIVPLPRLLSSFCSFSLHENKFNPGWLWLGNCKFPSYEEGQMHHGILCCRRNPVFQGDPFGHQKKGDAVVRVSLQCTSLALNARVQLCADFFLRTSCGSHNNDSRALPPLSQLKYGNCIIQVQGPWFSHNWIVKGIRKCLQWANACLRILW